MDGSPWQFEITRPLWLVALAVLPVMIYFWRRSLVRLARWQRTASLAVRVLLLVLLCIAACGIRWRTLCRGAISGKPLDGRPEHEIYAAIVKPRVLLVEGHAGSARRLATALANQEIDAVVRPPENMPESLAELEDYDLLILADVPAAALPARRMEAVQQFVEKLGGGLIVIGGDQSFTAGGYRNNIALEEILPVYSNLNLAMVLVIDESGSMKEEGRIDLAKEASKRAVDMLGPRDLLGVIGFGDQSRWVCPIELCSDQQRKQYVHEQIDKIATSFVGTNLYPAIQEAYAALGQTGADLKHMIFLTDATDLTAGRYKAEHFQALTEQIVKAGVTVSAVAVGKGSDVELLQKLAETSQQVHYYYRDDPTELPAIFAKDIRRRIAAGKRGIVERSFAPQVVNPAEVPSALDLHEMPPLAGYVETLPKENGRVILAAENGYPLLAVWQRGRGLSVAFTSAVAGPWAEPWHAWSGFDRFWAQLARYAVGKDESRDFVLRARWKSGRAQVILDVLDPQGAYVNGAEGTLKVTNPEQQTDNTSFVQIAPGRYAADFAASTPGDYRLVAKLRLGDQPVHARPYGLRIRLADELPAKAIQENLLRPNAQATGGQDKTKPSEVLAPSGTSVPRTMRLWPYLLTAAVLLFVADVALKRIDLSWYNMLFERSS